MGIQRKKDALSLITEDHSSLRNAILTPNHNEFLRLFNTVCPDFIMPDCAQDESMKDLVFEDQKRIEETIALAKKLKAIVIRKGPIDIISNGRGYEINHNKEFSLVQKPVGSRRRVGGQGDILAGATTALLGFHYCSLKYPLEWGQIGETDDDHETNRIAAAIGACIFTRLLSFTAYEKNGRAMTTSSLLQEIGTIQSEFQELIRTA